MVKDNVIEEGDIVSYGGDLFEFRKGMGARTSEHLRGYTIEKHDRLIKEKDQEIDRLKKECYSCFRHGDKLKEKEKEIADLKAEIERLTRK